MKLLVLRLNNEQMKRNLVQLRYRFDMISIIYIDLFYAYGD